MPSSQFPAAGPADLRILLAPTPWTAPLRSRPDSDAFRLLFDGTAEASTRFKAYVREGAYDCGELALATILQAREAGKDIVVLPLVVSGNFQHGAIAYDTSRGEMAPGDVAGKRIGVRSYAQTTCLWARAALQDEYGVDPALVTWVTLVDGHVAELSDPPNCERAPAGSKLVEMLLAGDIDAAILGSKMPADKRLASLIPQPTEAAGRWSAAHGGVRPINHLFTVSKALCGERPDILRALWTELKTARAATPLPYPLGLDADWTALNLAGHFAAQQRIVSREWTAEALLADFARIMAA